MQAISSTDETWAVISVNPRKSPKNSLRYCPANSIILSTEAIQASAFDGIWHFAWYGNENVRQQWIYEPRLENYGVRGLLGDYEVDNERIARTIAVGSQAYDLMINECDANPENRAQYLKDAKVKSITTE